jgi:hypothetical protein
MAKTPKKRTAPATPAGARAAAPKPAAATRTNLKVQATRMGIFQHGRRRENDVFTLTSEREFNPSWMRWVDAGTPEKVTGPKEHLKNEHDQILGQQVGQPGQGPETSGGTTGTGPDNV